MTEIIIGGSNNLGTLSPIRLAALQSSIRDGEYNLFLGAGVSLDAKNDLGPLMSGSQLKQTLCALTGARDTSTMQRVFSGLSDAQVREHITDRFKNCEPGPTSLQLTTYIWRRIFTLNIDNVIEAAYKNPGHLQSPKPYHFRDTYEEVRTLNVVPIIHLHGWAQTPDRGYVFSRSEYARLMSDTNAWMTVLADLMPVEPFIISGTTLDEVDLEYYLARRNSDTERQDRGPSFFVEPYPDGQTAKDCEDRGLILYKGTMHEFLKEVDFITPRRVAPINLVSSDTRGLFPAGSPQNVVLSFASDFDRVPSGVAPGGEPLKFSYGGPPDWKDLAGNWDIGRAITLRMRRIVQSMIDGSIPEKLLIILDNVGTGKTTVLRRLGFDIAAANSVVLSCSAISRLDPQTVAEAIDLIDEPLIVLVDNIAEQISPIASIIGALEKRDVVFVCAERKYRKTHIMRAAGDIPYQIIDGLTLTQSEATQLVKNYVSLGRISSPAAVKMPAKYSTALLNEPIVVACCKILNDMKPLDKIVSSTYDVSSTNERERYLISTLAQFCFSGGVRREILIALTDATKWDDQFNSSHPLPLDYYDSRHNFVVPLNATIAVRTLERAPAEDVARAFERLALGIAPRVNREAIRKRAPEARLAGRLFDYEDVLRRFLPAAAGAFYAKVQRSWQWNSRYWEQVALYHLARFRNEKDEILLREAVQHARHAVAIENHPYPLTTLGKILLAQLGQPGMSNTAIFQEAEQTLTKAISIESARGRASVAAYVTLFRGAIEYVDLGQFLESEQRTRLLDLVRNTRKYFPLDKELREIGDVVASKV